MRKIKINQALTDAELSELMGPVEQTKAPRLNPGRLAADLLKFAQWSDVDTRAELDQEFLEQSRNASTGSHGHFLEALQFLRLANVALIHAEHQAKFELCSELGADVSDPCATRLANSSLRLAQKLLKQVSEIQSTICDQVPE
jgi:hypothetical protein